VCSESVKQLVNGVVSAKTPSEEVLVSLIAGQSNSGGVAAFSHESNAMGAQEERAIQ